KITIVTSSAHFNTLLTSNSYVIVDFHADWCGPCKAIAPVFDKLATAEAKPGRVAFCKVDVDAQQDVAQKYSVSAMPTFLIFKSGSVVDTIRGANPPALTAAVRKAAADAAKGPGKTAAVFQSKGYTLGGADAPSRPVAQSWGQSLGGFGGPGVMDMLVRFVALYLTSLASFDGYKAAEESPFNVRNRR
ncbi:thioredoxin-domain-containing protein, partial [Lophium mytilinum]